MDKRHEDSECVATTRPALSIKPGVLERLRLLMDDSRRGTLLSDEFDTLVAQESGADVELLRRTFEAYNTVRRGDAMAPDSEVESLLQEFQSTHRHYPYFHWVVLNILGISQYRAQRYELALDTYKRGALFAAEHGLRNNETCSLLNLGFTHAARNEAELALRHLLPVATARTYPWHYFCFANQFLASLYRDHDEPDREFQHLCSSAQSRTTLEGRSLLARKLVHLGRVTEARNLLDSTNLDYLNDGVRLEWCYHLVAHGTTLAAEGKPNEALLALAAAEKSYAKFEANKPLALIEIGAAKFALSTGNANEALRRIEHLTIEQMRIGDARQCLDLTISAHTYLGNHHDVAWNQRLRAHLVDANTLPLDHLEAIRSEVLRDTSLPPRSSLPQVLTSRREQFHDRPGSPRADLAHDLFPQLEVVELLQLSTRSSEARGATLRSIHQSLHHRLNRSRLALPTEELILTDLLDLEIAELSPSLRVAGPRVTSFWSPNNLRVRANDAALRFLVHGLLCNAVLSAQIGGAVEVQFTILNEHAIVRVLDSGEGWGPESGPPEFRRMQIDHTDSGGVENGRELHMFLVHMVASELRVDLQGHSPGLGSGTTYLLKVPLATS